MDLPTSNKRRIFVVFRFFTVFLLASLSTIAFSNDESSNVSRSHKPISLQVGLGNPAPAYLGVSVGWQMRPDLQLFFSHGKFWSEDLNLYSSEAALRIYLLETQLSPVMGGGINSLIFKGQGNIQTLSESTLLLSIFLGLDWALHNGFRATAGVNFHVPLRLNFPTLCLGWSF